MDLIDGLDFKIFYCNIYNINMGSHYSSDDELAEINDLLKENDDSNISGDSDETILSGFSNLGVGERTPPRTANRSTRQRLENSGISRTFNAYEDGIDDNLDSNALFDFDAIDEVVGSEMLGELFAEISSMYHDENFQLFIEAIFDEMKKAIQMSPGETKLYRNIIDYEDGVAIYADDSDLLNKHEILFELKEILTIQRDDNIRILNLKIREQELEPNRAIKKSKQKVIDAYRLRIDLFNRLIKKCQNYHKRDYSEMDREFISIRGGKNKSKKNRKSNRKTKKQFLFNPNDPKKSFDVYIDKNPRDTIPIKYTTIKDVQDTINKLETLYKTGKYPHKRIWQVGMIMKVRLEAMKKHKKKLYPKAKNVTKRFNLSNKYFKFLKKRSKESNNKTRKSMKFKT